MGLDPAPVLDMHRPTSPRTRSSSTSRSKPRYHPVRTAAALLLAGALAGPSPARTGNERAVVVVDPANAESLYVANVYADRRDLPASNFVYMAPGATNYAEFAAANLPGFLGDLQHRGLAEHVDFVVIPPGGSFFVPAGGLVSDMCAPVQRFAVASCYTMAFMDDAVLGGNLLMSERNQYAKNNYFPRSFSSREAWVEGQPSTDAGARRYFIGAMLGYTGERGNTLTEVLAMIDRSAAVDGTFPPGTVYYMQTTDSARSSPRHDAYPNAVTRIEEVGGQAQHLFANLPLGNDDCAGVMTGLASPDIDGGDFTLVDGAFADHLTSFAGRFDTSSQVKMSRWIAKGASGSAGTVEEPCNYSGKFPHARLHGIYLRGLTLGEAWFRSVQWTPFQLLLYGDPLTRPWSYLPAVDVPATPSGPVAGTVTLSPTASPTHPMAGIRNLQLLVDGRLAGETAGVADFQVETTALSDGWHEVRVLAFDDEPEHNVASWKGALEVDNAGLSASLSVLPASGDLAQPFTFTAAGAGGPVEELQLVQNGRVVAATDQAADALTVFGQNLGAGPVEVQLVARFTDGSLARSAPVALDVAYDAGTPAGMAPVAFDFTKEVRDDAAFVVELPAAFDGDVGEAAWSLTGLPAQATLLSAPDAPYAIFVAETGATGSDTLTFQVTTGGGTASGTVTLVYTRECAPPTTFCTSLPNSSGAAATMGAFGSSSIAANDLVLTADQAPAGVPGLFFYGSSQVSVPFGDGLRCAGGMTFRLNPPVFVDGSGHAERPLDVTAPPTPAGQIAAGFSWNFQLWFRDVAAGGAGFNLTDGLTVEFCP